MICSWIKPSVYNYNVRSAATLADRVTANWRVCRHEQLHSPYLGEDAKIRWYVWRRVQQTTYTMNGWEREAGTTNMREAHMQATGGRNDTWDAIAQMSFRWKDVRTHANRIDSTPILVTVWHCVYCDSVDCCEMVNQLWVHVCSIVHELMFRRACMKVELIKILYIYSIKLRIRLFSMTSKGQSQ